MRSELTEKYIPGVTEISPKIYVPRHGSSHKSNHEQPAFHRSSNVSVVEDAFNVFDVLV